MEIKFYTSSANKQWDKKIAKYVRSISSNGICSDEEISNLVAAKTLIEESENYDELMKNPLWGQFSPHRLQGNRNNQISISLTKKKRFTFVLKGLPNKDFFSNDFSRITEIYVIDVSIDYHK